MQLSIKPQLNLHHHLHNGNFMLDIIGVPAGPSEKAQLRTTHQLGCVLPRLNTNIHVGSIARLPYHPASVDQILK